jgi:hypothetical protein
VNAIEETVLFVFMAILVIGSIGGVVVVLEIPDLVILVAPLVFIYGWWWRLLLELWASERRAA